MRLIIIDGLDGVGKDTQARLIKNRYEKSGDKVKIRSHPESDNYFGRQAKKALLGKGKLNKLKASVFYMMDVLFSIRRYYQKNGYNTLIMVRYLVGTAYLPERFAKIAYRFFVNFVPTSDYMFFLDAPPEILLNRVKNRKEKEMFENLEEFENVRKKALYLVRNWNIINISGSINDSFSKIENILNKLDKKD
jgi:dTMP kinase